MSNPAVEIVTVFDNDGVTPIAARTGKHHFTVSNGQHRSTEIIGGVEVPRIPKHIGGMATLVVALCHPPGLPGREGQLEVLGVADRCLDQEDQKEHSEPYEPFHCRSPLSKNSEDANQKDHPLG